MQLVATIEIVNINYHSVQFKKRVKIQVQLLIRATLNIFVLKVSTSMYIVGV